MAEKVSTDLDGKIENAMPREDANQTPTEPTQGPSFVKDPAKQAQESKRQVTTLDVLLYLGKQLKQIREQNEVLSELLKEVLKKLSAGIIPSANAYVTPPTQILSQPAMTEPPVVTDEGQKKIEVALVDFLKDGSLTVNTTENTMFYIVRSTKFLGTDNFAKIASIVRGLGGEYVSQGKASHFKIPKSGK